MEISVSCDCFNSGGTIILATQKQNYKNMKLTLLTLLATATVASAAITVSPTSGTYMFESEGNYNTATSGGTTLHDDGGTYTHSSTATLNFDLTGLDFANYTYTFSLDSSIATGSGNDGAPVTVNGSAPVAINGNGFNSYADYTLATDQALTGSTLAVSNNMTVRYDNFDLTITATPIPEPTSAALLGLGGLALVARRRRA